MSILDTRISTFKNTRSTEVIKSQVDSVGLYLERIQNGTYKKTIERLRGGDETAKLELPTVAFHGTFDTFRKKKDFIEASGLIILDIDDIDPEDNLEEIKADMLEESDHVLAIMVSPSGNGLKILYYVTPDLITADNYRQIGKQVISNFSLYGHVDYLSITDCLIMTYDPDIVINKDVEPAFIYIEETTTHKVELEKLDKDKALWEDVEDFFDTVLNDDIESKTNNNYHFIQVSLLDLAKFGFTHPEEDLSFVIDYSENAFGSSPKNKQRFLEASVVAKQYPKIQWPYKTFADNGESDDEYVDYSDYTQGDDDAGGKAEGVEESGLIDYLNFYNEVVEVVKEGDRVGFEISLKNFADVFRFKGTGILTVTGIPGHGKTEFVDQIIIDLARLYKHESIVVGFEQTPAEHTVKNIRRMVGANVTCPSYFNPSNEPEFKEAYNFVTKYIKHIDTNKVGGNVNKILEFAAKQIKESRGNGGDPRYLIMDPFNMLSIKGRFSGHEKIEEILRRLTHFSHQMGVLVILVAHPFKMRKDEKSGEYEVPDFYSVKGSSAFFEMSYHGLVVYRTGYQPSDPVFAKPLKLKQNNLGIVGEKVFFIYDKPSGRYIPIDEEGNEISGDHRDKNWLEKIKEN